MKYFNKLLTYKCITCCDIFYDLGKFFTDTVLPVGNGQ